MSLEVLLEPAAGGGHVVEDQVEHQIHAAGEVCDVAPASQIGIDRSVVGDGESVVGGRGKEREEVQEVEDPIQAFVEKPGVERLQGCFSRAANLVAVGDEQNVSLAPGCRRGSRARSGYRAQSSLSCVQHASAWPP